MCLLFALSVGAVYTGVAAIVGAFLAGLALAETTAPRVRDLAHGVTELLVPFFLTGIGLHVDLTAFTDRRDILLAAVIVFAAGLSKVIGCGTSAYGLARRDGPRVG